MALAQEQRGEYVERFIADLSSMFFLNDFVFRKPSYITGGQKREVTDLLLVLNQECILISVKGTDGEEKADDRFHLWVQKKAGQASNNAKVACQRTARLEISGVNLWGEETAVLNGPSNQESYMQMLCSAGKYCHNLPKEQNKSECTIH